MYMYIISEKKFDLIGYFLFDMLIWFKVLGLIILKFNLVVFRVKLFWFEFLFFSIYCGGVEEIWKFVIIFYNIY